MSYNVETVRQSITIITKILSGKGLKVTQSGDQAYVESVAGIPKRINIPYIPDNASDELMLAINGFLDHEVAHVLFTDFSISQKHHFKSKSVFQIYNIIEDCRIESRMRAKFAGSKFNLDGVAQFLIDRFLTEDFKKSKESGNEKEIVRSLFVPAIRAWSGQDVFQRYMADKVADIKPLADKIKAQLPLISRVDSTQDAIDLAHEIFKALEDKSESKDKSPKTEKKKKDEMKSGEESKSEESGSGEKSEESKEGEKSEPETKGGTDEENSSSEPSEEPKPEEPKPEPEASSEDEADDSPESNEESEPEASSEDEADDDSDSESESEGESDQDEEPESDDEPKDDMDHEENDDDKDGDTEDVSDWDRENESEDSSSEEGDSEEGDSEEATISLSDVIGSDEFDSSRSISEIIAREIGAMSNDEDYRIFSTDFDVIENFDATRCRDKDQVNRGLIKIETETRKVAGVLQKTLERLVKAKANTRNLPGKRSGKVNPSSLFRLKTDDYRVFRQKTAGTNNEVAVSLVVDCSESMSGDKIRLAMEGAFALCDTLTRLGITNEVIGFTTKSGSEIDQGILNERKNAATDAQVVQYSRLEPLFMPIFKGFNEQFGTEQKKRIASASLGGAFMRNNVDGESLRIAAKRLMAMTSERTKQIIVLSDGSPAGLGDWSLIAKDLDAATKDVEKMGIKLIGIGIDDNSVKRYYKNNLVISNISELPTMIVKELKALLV